MTRHVLMVAVVVIGASSGCVTPQAPGASVRGPKTLLSWNVGGAGPGDGAVESPPTSEAGGEEPLATDRPDFTEASSTVGRGRVQLEAGYTYSQDRDGGETSRGHSYPETLLRIGLFADWFELRLGQNFASSRLSNPGGVEKAGGAEDLYIGTKLALAVQKGIFPETALILQATVPSGSRDFTAGEFLPGVSLLYGWDVIPDRLTFAGSTQANRAIDGGSSAPRRPLGVADGDPAEALEVPVAARRAYAEVAQSLTVGYGLTPKVGAYTEWFAFFPTGATTPDVGPEHYFNGGFTYRPVNNLQFDVRAGVGLNRQADDFFAGTGFAVRY